MSTSSRGEDPDPVSTPLAAAEYVPSLRRGARRRMIATAPRSPIRRSGSPAQRLPDPCHPSPIPSTSPFRHPPAGSSLLRRRLILDSEEIPLVLLQGIPHPGEHGDRIGAPSPLTPLLRHGYRHPAPPPRNPSRWRSSPSTSSKAPFIIGLPLLPCLPLRRRPVVAGLRESDPPLRPPLQLRSAAEGVDGGGQTDEPRMQGDWEEDCRGGDRSVTGEELGVYAEERQWLRSCLRLLGSILGLGVGLRGIRPEVHGCREGNRFLKIERCRLDPGRKRKSEFLSEPKKDDGCLSACIGNLAWGVTDDDKSLF